MATETLNYRLFPCVKVENENSAVVNVYMPFGKAVPYTKTEFEQVFVRYNSEKEKLAVKLLQIDTDIEITRAEIESSKDAGTRNILQQQMDAMVAYRNILQIRYENESTF